MAEEVVEVWEFARKGVFGGYSPSKLLPTDPPQYEDFNTHVRYASLDSVALPERGDWVWETEWIEVVPWEYAWNVTASTWKPKDGAGMWFRRRRWRRVRRSKAVAAADPAVAMSGATDLAIAHVHNAPGNPNPELIDLSAVKLVYSCRANRNRKDISAMVGLPNVQLIMCSYSSPNSFFANWARYFTVDAGRTQAIVKEGAVFVLYDLDDEEVLFSLLLPVLTESGEYRSESRVADLTARFERFAIVLPGWQGSTTMVIPKLATDVRTMPPIRFAVHSME